MTHNYVSQNEFPGAPKVLPPLMHEQERECMYFYAVSPRAKVEWLAAVYADVGQRLAKALRSEPEVK